jgi:branched-chain amino acid transport system ATP-binding protein
MKHIKNVQERNKKISIVIIEHDMSVISDVSDFVIVFNAGQEIARGKFEEISKEKNVRLAYLGGTQ